MRHVTWAEVKVGKRYLIVQEYLSGSKATFEGIATATMDEYIYFKDLPRINVHSYVGMPNVQIIELS